MELETTTSGYYFLSLIVQNIIYVRKNLLTAIVASTLALIVTQKSEKCSII